MQFTSTLIVALLAVSSFPTRTTAQQVSNLRGARQLEEEALSDDWLFDDCPFYDKPSPETDIRMKDMPRCFPNYNEQFVKKCQQTTGCVWTCPNSQILCYNIRNTAPYAGLYCHDGKYDVYKPGC